MRRIFYVAVHRPAARKNWPNDVSSAVGSTAATNIQKKLVLNIQNTPDHVSTVPREIATDARSPVSAPARPDRSIRSHS